MLQWNYLAKTCWGPSVEGELELTLEFTSHECHLRDCSLDGVDYSKEQLPDIMFYASYDKSFAIAAVEANSNTANAKPTSSKVGTENLDSICRGDGNIFREKVSCQETSNGSKIQPTCKFQKTYNVMNRGLETTLVYLVVANCNVSGRVAWSIRTDLSQEFKQDTIPNADQTHGVCGALGVSTGERCFSDAGGTCHVQEPAVLRMANHWDTNNKITRGQIAIMAVLFSLALTFGLGGIKYYQTRQKREKQRMLLQRGTLASPQMPQAVSSSDEGGFQSNGDSVQPHRLDIMQHSAPR